MVGRLFIVLLSSTAFGCAAAHAQSSKHYTHASPAFSLDYPAGYTLNETYTDYRFGPANRIHGVALTVPVSLATNSNLSVNSYVSVEWLDGTACTIDQFLQNASPPTKVSDRGVEYQKATSSSAGAGNFYDETVFLKGCLVVRYFVHTLNFSGFPPGVVKEFDRAALMASFDAIRRSLK